jgi:hypothetical protein
VAGKRGGAFDKRRYRIRLYSWRPPIMQRGPFPDTGEVMRVVGLGERRLYGVRERRGG